MHIKLHRRCAYTCLNVIGVIWPYRSILINTLALGHNASLPCRPPLVASIQEKMLWRCWTGLVRSAISIRDRGSDMCTKTPIPPASQLESYSRGLPNGVTINLRAEGGSTSVCVWWWRTEKEWAWPISHIGPTTPSLSMSHITLKMVIHCITSRVIEVQRRTMERLLPGRLTKN